MILYIADPIACDSIWIVGDTFVGNSYGKILHSESSTEKFYIREQFQAYAFFNPNHFDSNFLSRTRNVLVKAMNDNAKLPKVIVMVLENDLIRSITHSNFGVSLEAGILLEWLVKETSKVIFARKNQLSSKFKKALEPHVLWLGLPINDAFRDNEKRVKFNQCLEKIIPLYDNMSVL